MSERKKLWDSQHQYYCSRNNYFKNGCTGIYCGAHEFIDEFEGSDMDLNLLFRWDWRDADIEDERENDEVELFFMAQRKGRFFSSVIVIDPRNRDEDERLLYDFIAQRWDHLRSLWEPFGTAQDER